MASISAGPRPAEDCSRIQFFIDSMNRACAAGSVLGRLPTTKVPSPGPGAHQASALEVSVGLEDRVRIDGELRHHLLGRRELVAGLQHAQPECLVDLLDQLEIRGHARPRVELELDHSTPFH